MMLPVLILCTYLRRVGNIDWVLFISFLCGGRKELYEAFFVGEYLCEAGIHKVHVIEGVWVISWGFRKLLRLDRLKVARRRF